VKAGPDRATLVGADSRHTGAVIDDIELGAFLRARREATSPADVGLPIGPRRRTPGLRRAELATLAGISVDYLIRLEQGRDTNPSAQVVAALASALRLGEEDLAHLRNLVAVNAHGALCPASVAPATAIRPTVQSLLTGLEPAPAFVINRLSDLLAWTSTYDRLVRPVGMFDGARANLLRYTFTDERAHTTYPDWDDIADEQVGNLQAAFRPEDAEGQALIAHLSEVAGPAFTDRWATRPVGRKRSGTELIVHPEVGEVRVAFETLQLPDPDDQRLVVYLPGDAASARALDALAGRHPGNLRAVGE
jgi:transcriptional regulator with XRE-family HTH domain